MMRPEDFATPAMPIRASMLNSLAKCHGFAFLDMEDSRPVGAAAHTGTAVGRAIELYHRGYENEESLNIARREAVAGGPKGFPLARWDEVESALTSYTLDGRNPRSVVVRDSLEEEVTLSMDAHPLDTTKAAIRVKGHIDQVRFEGGTYSVWDLKHGRPEGKLMLSSYLWQQAVYTLAYASKYPDRRVSWGGIIRLRGYAQSRRVSNPHHDPSRKASSKKGGVSNAKTHLIPYSPDSAPVFFHAPYRRTDLLAVIDQIRLAVALVRNGTILLTPGEHCGWCKKDGFHDCYPDLQERGFQV